MNKIYQKMYLQNKNRSKSVLGGFTLIELLVVVLIIGILAAVALPQYERAVLRSRMATARPMLATMKEAIRLYHMETGEWPASLDDLSIQVPEDEGFWMHSAIAAWGEEAAPIVVWTGLTQDSTIFGLAASVAGDVWACCGNAIADNAKLKELCKKAGYTEDIGTPTGGLRGCYKQKGT